MTYDQIARIAQQLQSQATTEFYAGETSFEATVRRFEDIHTWAASRREVACVALVEAPGGLVYVG